MTLYDMAPKFSENDEPHCPRSRKKSMSPKKEPIDQPITEEKRREVSTYLFMDDAFDLNKF